MDSEFNWDNQRSFRWQEIMDMLNLAAKATNREWETTLDKLWLGWTIYNIALNLATLTQCEFELLKEIDLRWKKVQLIRIKETWYLHIAWENVKWLILPSLNNQIKFNNYLWIWHTHSPCLIFQANDWKRYNLYLNWDMEQKVY